MKCFILKISLAISLSFYGNAQFAQTIPNFDIIKLGKASDYKLAEPFALQTSTYLLSTPITKGNADRTKAVQFLGKWMAGTMDHSFRFDETAMKLLNGNNDLISVYMGAMVKYTLENKDSSKNSKLVKLNAMTSLLNYCENKDNKMPLTKSLKKLAEAKANGELEKYL